MLLENLPAQLYKKVLNSQNRVIEVAQKPTSIWVRVFKFCTISIQLYISCPTKNWNQAINIFGNIGAQSFPWFAVRYMYTVDPVYNATVYNANPDLYAVF